MSIQEKVLKQISEQRIEPTARAWFTFKNISLWFAAVVFGILGTLAAGTLLHVLDDGDWDIYGYFGRSFIEHSLIIFPYFWVAVIILFVSLAYVMTRITKTGYRYRTHMLVIAGVLMVAVTGSALYALGIGQEIDEALTSYSTLYTQLPHHKENIWSRPEVGLLSGTITRILNNNEFALKDFTGHTWTIEEGDVEWKRGAARKVGTKLKLIGMQENDTVFVATEVRPWETVGGK